jgi:hypothetical protein
MKTIEAALPPCLANTDDILGYMNIDLSQIFDLFKYIMGWQQCRLTVIQSGPLYATRFDRARLVLVCFGRTGGVKV